MSPSETVPNVRHVTAADGVVLQHETIGNGPPIVCLHGGFSGRNSFNRQREALDGYRLIPRDLRGHNGTEPRVPDGYRFETTEVDDLRRVLDAEGIDRATLIGHSSGGTVAFAFARAEPARVDRLILIEPTLFDLLTGEPRAAAWRALEGAIAIARQTGDLIAATRAVFSFTLRPGWETGARPVTIAQLEAAAPLVVAHCRGLLDVRVSDADLRALHPPTLLIHGAETIPSYLGVFERFAEVRPDLPRHLIPGAAHPVHIQQPAIVNRLIADFLARSAPA